MPKRMSDWTVMLMILVTLGACFLLSACDLFDGKKKATPTHTPFVPEIIIPETVIIPETPIPMRPKTPEAELFATSR